MTKQEDLSHHLFLGKQKYNLLSPSGIRGPKC